MSAAVDGHGGEVEVRHGYTLADLDKLARQIMYRSRWGFLSFHDKYELAWSAMAELLAARADVPSLIELVDRGERAIGEYVTAELRTHGVHVGHRDRGHHGLIRRHYVYWWSIAQRSPSPEARVIERLALAQIWPRLTRRNRQVLEALAEQGDYQRAARTLGVSYKSFVTMIYYARKQFLRLWHDGETPSKFWGRDTRINPEAKCAEDMLRSRAQRSLRRRALTRTDAPANVAEPPADRWAPLLDPVSGS